MRSIKTGLLGFAVASLLGTLAVVGCSADGATEDVVPTTGTDNTNPEQPGAQLPANSSSGDPDPGTGGTDAGKKDAGKDAGKADAAKDAGPPPPNEGDACPTADVIFKRTCGKCGTQEAVCLASGSGTGGTVSAYGDCKAEVVNGCVPGTTESVACGNCGTQQRTCNNYCAWSTAACTGQPANSCTPGAVELVGAGCPADQYRQRSCQAACTWNNFSATCSPPPTYVLVPPTVGSTNSTISVLRSTQTAARLPSYGTCPLTATAFPPTSPTITPYAYIEVRNTLSKAVTVSVYNSQASGGPIIDTVMAAYPGATVPTTDAARRACVGSMGDYGNTSLTGDSEFASLDATKAVPIPANSSVQIYFASYSAFDAATPDDSTGMIKLNVRTETIAP